MRCRGILLLRTLRQKKKKAYSYDLMDYELSARTYRHNALALAHIGMHNTVYLIFGVDDLWIITSSPFSDWFQNFPFHFPYLSCLRWLSVYQFGLGQFLCLLFFCSFVFLCLFSTYIHTYIRWMAASDTVNLGYLLRFEKKRILFTIFILLWLFPGIWLVLG